jgi:hypothetical protein
MMREAPDRKAVPRRMVLGAAAACFLTAACAVLWRIPPLSLIALFSATLLVEYGAAAVGISFGLSPAFLFAFITAVTVAIVCALFAVFDTLAASSDRVSRFLGWAQQNYAGSRFVRNYGIFSLVPLILLIGFYFTPPVAWFMGWERRRSIVLMVIGEIIGIALTLAMTSGVLQAFGF